MNSEKSGHYPEQLSLTKALSETEQQLLEPDFEGRYPIEELAGRLGEGAQVGAGAHLQISGALGALRACVLADLSHRIHRPIVVLSASEADARELADDLGVFALDDDEPYEGLLDQVVHYPDFDIGPYHSASPERKMMMQRLGALHLLGGQHPPRYTVAPVAAALRKTIGQEALRAFTRHFELGDEMVNEDLRVYLANCGYGEVAVVEDPGTFAIRGDIIDIFVAASAYPMRVERWGDEINEIRSFNPQTQRTVEEHLGFEIIPARQEILDETLVRDSRARLRALAETLGYSSRKVREITMDLEAGLHFIGIDALLPALHAEVHDLLDYIPENALVVLVEPEAALGEAQHLNENQRAEYAREIDKGELVFPVDRYYREAPALLAWVEERAERLEFRRVAMHRAKSASPSDELSFALAKRADSFVFLARPNTDVVRLRKENRGVQATIEALVGELQRWKKNYGRICFACRTAGQVDRLVSLLKSYGEDAIEMEPPIDVGEPVPPPAGLIEVYKATISAGFRSEHLGLCLISGEEVFGKRVATRETKSITEHAEITHFRDLKPGDYVVHVDFGIGKYHGLINLEVAEIKADFLHLEYADGAKLYIPVHRLGKVQKYIGSASDSIRLDKMGGSSWERTKERVKDQIRAIAGDLLRLYAQRDLARGHRFSAPDDFYREFEEAFPYEETPDQARAIRDTLADMQGKRPMDRLICGDVGFGKTEVAIRAAMKAVMDGKQVAVLVPTTILSEQHRISFRQRCEKFGARVEALSRFRSEERRVGKECRSRWSP